MPRQVDMTTTEWVDNSQVKGLIVWLLAVMSRRTHELSFGGKEGEKEKREGVTCLLADDTATWLL